MASAFSAVKNVDYRFLGKLKTLSKVFPQLFFTFAIYVAGHIERPPPVLPNQVHQISGLLLVFHEHILVVIPAIIRHFL